MTIVGALELDRTLPSHGNKGKIVSTIPTVKNDFSVAIAVESFEHITEESGQPAWVKRTELLHYPNRPDEWEVRETRRHVDGTGNSTGYNWSHSTEAAARNQFEKIRSNDGC